MSLAGSQSVSLWVAGLLAVLISVACEEPTLQQLCDDKQVRLTKISLTRKLIEENESTSRESCNRYKDSLDQLDKILVTVQSGKICDLALVDEIRKYHENFIATSNNKARDNIPKPLRHFFISLCFQINAECKMALINNLEYDTKQKLKDEDYDEIRFLERNGATLLDSETEISDFDDILLLDDLNQAAGLRDQSGESRILIKVKTNKMLRLLVENCNMKFKPFYDKLIMPLIKLSNLGYNYQGELLEREMKELKSNKLVRRWYNIVQICEAFSTLQIFEDAEPLELNNGYQAITFITGDMAENLRKNNVKTIEEEIVADEMSRGVKDATIEYDPVASHNDDELWIKDQKELEKLVLKYKTSMTEADHVRSKLLKKIIAHIKGIILSGKVPMLATELIKSRFGGEDAKKTSSVAEELVMMMDEAVRQDEIYSDMAGHIGVQLEAPVSGLGTKTNRKVVSKFGPVSQVKHMNMPSRTKFVPFTVDGTKSTTKFMNFGSKFLPRRMNIFMWILAISGFLMIAMAIFTG